MHHSTTFAEFRRGIIEAVPILIGVMPFGLILGTRAAQQGMGWLEVVLMMGLNFAGGSEFAAVSLWRSPLPVLLIIGTTFLINSRHILMGVAFIPFVRHLPLKKLLPVLFFMTDESWAMSLADVGKRQQAGMPAFSLPYYFGTAAALYLLWISCGFIGARFGYLLGNVENLGFGMAFPAVFLVLMRGMWRTWRAALPWLASLISAAGVYLLSPHNGWYVLAGTFVGLAWAFFDQGAQHD